jgi:hypothetical protein
VAARAHWLTVEWQPKYAPELNDIEIVWRDLKAHHLAHQTFVDADALDRAIHQAVGALNAERMALPLAEQRISAMKIAKPTSAGLKAQRLAVIFIHNGAPQALVGCLASAAASRSASTRSWASSRSASRRGLRGRRCARAGRPCAPTDGFQNIAVDNCSQRPCRADELMRILMRRKKRGLLQTSRRQRHH